MLRKILATAVLSLGLVSSAVAAPGTSRVKYTMVMLNMDGTPTFTTYNSYSSYSQCVALLNSIIPTNDYDVSYSNGYALWCTPSIVITASTTSN